MPYEFFSLLHIPCRPAGYLPTFQLQQGGCTFCQPVRTVAVSVCTDWLQVLTFNPAKHKKSMHNTENHLQMYMLFCIIYHSQTISSPTAIGYLSLLFACIADLAYFKERCSSFMAEATANHKHLVVWRISL